MRRELVIAAGPGEWRAALTEDGAAVELRIERGDGGEAGSIHLGRVLRLLPALGAALVDIGGDRPAFLPHSEILPRGRRLDEGERCVVQVRREAQGGKAPRLTTAVALRGRFVELVAGRPGIMGDGALSAHDRVHLLGTIAGERPVQGPIGLRLLESARIETLADEAAALADFWPELCERARRLDPPSRLHPPASFAAALAGALPAPDRIFVDEPAAMPEIRAAFADAEVAHRPESRWPVDLDALFDEALSPTLALAGGGSVHIEATRAATLVDVDSGTPETGSPEQSALAVNLAAARLIAQQIRLRSLGGGIVVDFVGLDDRRARERVRAAFAGALMADPAKPQLLGWTRLGHLELVRPRRTRPLAEALLELAAGGPLVRTAVTVALEALRALRREARAQPGRRWRLVVAPEVAAALAGGAAAARCHLEQRLGREIAVAPDPRLDRAGFQIAQP
jgi:ribonuclease G